MPCVTCFGCGAREDCYPGEGVRHHHDGCPVLAGADWRCSCHLSGPYCHEECDGAWVYPDGRRRGGTGRGNQRCPGRCLLDTPEQAAIHGPAEWAAPAARQEG